MPRIAGGSARLNTAIWAGAPKSCDCSAKDDVVLAFNSTTFCFIFDCSLLVKSRYYGRAHRRSSAAAHSDGAAVADAGVLVSFPLLAPEARWCALGKRCLAAGRILNYTPPPPMLSSPHGLSRARCYNFILQRALFNFVKTSANPSTAP